MMRVTTTVAMAAPAFAFTLFLSACAPDAASSPYVGQETREIKALGPEEVEGLLTGEGLGYALAAELNGLPGPRHVLDAAAELGLDAGQRSRIQAIFDDMNAEAVRLGTELVAGERDLDRLLAGGDATPEAVAEATTALGRLEGRLRAVHLHAHLATTPLLTEHQRARYWEIRGYAAGAADGGGQDHTAHPGH